MTSILSILRALRTFDRRRAGIPGEHWAAFGGALSVLSAARRIRSPALRTLALLAGGALVVRAVTGRDGALAFAQRKLRDRGEDGVVVLPQPAAAGAPRRVNRSAG